MVLMWSDALWGIAWGMWLAFYLDRVYLKQVTLIKLGVFVFWGRSFKANNMLATALNILLLSGFLFLASAVIGNFVSAWIEFVVGWFIGQGCYTFLFSSSKQSVPDRQGE
ncbi:hypothetical protein [Enterovibrio coralii]|uniref:Uncharacterized protein n=1 Tax=Enterovibrio coralii TaxID=294935 RepID=A0A135I3E4_9GAMM|nr:hypothetical protein [Enterovibrio coralii]KXF79948.1 hypothetical protein ATN88_11895 [Enterovibrio coralii]